MGAHIVAPTYPSTDRYPCTAAATINPIAMHIEPTTIASATFFFSTISPHRSYGVILSMMTNMIQKIATPISAYKIEPAMMPGFNHSIPIMAHLLSCPLIEDRAAGACRLHLCPPPPLEKPPYDPP